MTSHYCSPEDMGRLNREGYALVPSDVYDTGRGCNADSSRRIGMDEAAADHIGVLFGKF